MKNKHTFKSEMMTVSFCSVDVAEEITPDTNMALISIGTPDELNSICYSDWTHKIRVEFDDIIYKQDKADRLFNKIQAKQIIDFVQNLPTEVKHIAVHCWAGVSRSGATAKFLVGIVYPECFDEQFDRDYNLYNEHVYETLMNVWKSLRRKV